MLDLSMKRKLQQGDFVDATIESGYERIIVWSYAVHADAQLWKEVMADKWRLARYYQQGE